MFHSPSVARDSNHPHMGNGSFTTPEILQFVGETHEIPKLSHFFEGNPWFRRHLTDGPSHPPPSEAPQSPAALCVAVAFLDLGPPRCQAIMAH